MTSTQQKESETFQQELQTLQQGNVLRAIRERGLIKILNAI